MDSPPVTNILPFTRKTKPPTQGELAAYRQMTKNWSDAMRRLVFPQYQ